MGWSQADLANVAGLQQSALSHYENGARRPSFTNLRRLASALNVTTDYLVGHAPPRDADNDVLELTSVGEVAQYFIENPDAYCVLRTRFVGAVRA